MPCESYAYLPLQVPQDDMPMFGVYQRVVRETLLVQVDQSKPILPSEFTTRDKFERIQGIVALRCLRLSQRCSGRRVDWLIEESLFLDCLTLVVGVFRIICTSVCILTIATVGTVQSASLTGGFTNRGLDGPESRSRWRVGKNISASFGNRTEIFRSPVLLTAVPPLLFVVWTSHCIYGIYWNIQLPSLQLFVRNFNW
jgi:hypothetical protein